LPKMSYKNFPQKLHGWKVVNLISLNILQYSTSTSRYIHEPYVKPLSLIHRCGGFWLASQSCSELLKLPFLFVNFLTCFLVVGKLPTIFVWICLYLTRSCIVVGANSCNYVVKFSTTLGTLTWCWI
jgi:hypothetical protein